MKCSFFALLCRFIDRLSLFFAIGSSYPEYGTNRVRCWCVWGVRLLRRMVQGWGWGEYNDVFLMQSINETNQRP